MMTTLRSDRRTRRNASFTLESLDDRIVLSAASAVVAAESHLAAVTAAGKTKAIEKATLTLDRDEARLARVEAKAEKAEAKAEKASMKASTFAPTIIGSSSLATAPTSVSVNMTAATVNSTATASTPTTSMPVNTTAAPATTTSTSPTQAATTTTTSPTTSTTPLPPNMSAQLQSLYSQYESFESSGGSGTFSPTGMKGFVINGTNVGINFHTSNSSDFNAVLSDLESDGLQVSSDSPTYGIIDGTISIAQLPAVAQISSTASVTLETQPLAK